ncbi:protein mono-ADP-ribosyltransferase PARP14-like isoform X1 [Takifugu rubripes]|uniref:protein mono-ADP-ribosyltransferase PARP14-like isoform X1 n=1 Tax=Takifugu rubripes TaxID=31033 RepID=UPI001145E50C|nr:protein mono-ADP-ribosyltransferase PARP14-like isoform X1 [Takifugu rubripes]
MSLILPVIVEGDWASTETSRVKLKLELYFGSSKKSSGGECLVQLKDGETKAAVYFADNAVRAQVLKKQDHVITLNNQNIKLCLSEPSSLSSTDVKASDQPVRGATGDNQDESVQSTAVVLSPVTDKRVGELLVDNIMGSSFSAYTMELIFELDSTVVTFSNSEDQIKFLTNIKSSQALEKWQVTIRPLEAAVSIWVENLPLNVDEEILQLYFQRWTELNKKWMPKEIIIMPYQVAIITVGDPKVVKRICLHKEHTIRSASVRMYPYYESLRTPLYGKDRPVWKMPEPFIEAVEPLVWTFLESRKLWEVINDQMNQHFCSVNSEKPVVKLSPLPSFLKQAGLTADRVEKWKSTTQRTFHQLISQYRAFKCSMNGPAWKEAEKEIRLVVREDANLQLDASSETLTVVGQVEDINKIEAHVKDIAARAMRQIQQKREEVTESMEVAPTLFYILEQEGLQKVAQDKWSDMKLSYNKSSKKLTFRGSTSNVYPAKLWVVEKKHQLIQKQIDVSAAVFNFLKMVDSEKMSEELFTSKGICATYSINNNRILLLGCSDNVLAGAEQKIRTVFNHQTLDVEDTEVLLLPEWMSLKQRLLGLKNSSKTTVAILDQGRDQVTVVGFLDPVKEVSREVKEFIVDNARLEETLPVQSCALQFIVKKKKQDYIGIADACGIQIQIEEERPSISIAGARYRVLKARSLIQEMIGALSTDKLIVDKPGAKKYFQFQGSLFLSAIMNDLNCVVLLSSGRGKNGLCLYKVTALSGVQVYVSEANICLLDVDAVVNAANEELKHIGGLALALLNAAGPELQKISNNYIARNGALCTGDTVVTDACNLPCKHVIHAVGPRFSEHSPEDSVSLLKLVVTRSLKEAEKLNCSTIAMPAISSGMFGFPIDLCADTIAQAVWEHCSAPGGQGSLREIQLVTNNDQTAGALAEAVKKVFDNPQGAVRRPGPAASRVQGGRGQSHSPTSAQRGRLKSTDGNPEGAGIHGNSGGQSSSDQAGPEGCRLMEGTTAEGLRVILWKGNIEAQTSCVIVNTISESMNLMQGAISKAILQAAGQSLQTAIQKAAGVSSLLPGSVVITDGFNLKCQKVFHTVCPMWTSASDQAEKTLTSIITQCLKEAERLKMKSLSFPAIGTGVLQFPKEVVSRVLLREVHNHSRTKTPLHLVEVFIVVHPSDSKTENSLRTEFRSQFNQGQGSQSSQSATVPNSSQSQKPSASNFSQVVSTSLGAYQMQMGQLAFEVVSGDITKETCDVIINSSNQNFTLKSGVSKAIMNGAGHSVWKECLVKVKAAGSQPGPMILTSAGQLPCRAIIHVVGRNNPADVKNTVYSVLKLCEEQKFQSAAFPALGTGQGGASPSTVADAMVGAITDFVKKKQPKYVSSVKIVIFQQEMLSDFHNSMMKVQGEAVKSKGIIGTIKDAVTSIFGIGEDKPSTETLVLQKEEFEPAVFELCSENKKDVDQAKKRILELIHMEHTTWTIKDEYINQFTQRDIAELEGLQKQLSIKIHLKRGLDDQEPSIILEGLTRDVFNANAVIRTLIQKTQCMENQKQKAAQMSERVEWQFQDQFGQKVPFNSLDNLILEEAFQKKEIVTLKINGELYQANTVQRRACSARSHKEIELFRVDKKGVLPPHWEDMGDEFLKVVNLDPGSEEYLNVKQKATSSGRSLNILKIERIQNAVLWQGYQALKKSLEQKNGHSNNERLLFHGTKAQSVKFINKSGFNRSYAGMHGAMFGNGSYFAVDPNYSAQGYAMPDPLGHRRMYLAKVLVGDFTRGQAGLPAPPEKNPSDLYDSVTDNPAKPSMFVIFNDVQAYPEHLITFT